MRALGGGTQAFADDLFHVDVVGRPGPSFQFGLGIREVNAVAKLIEAEPRGGAGDMLVSAFRIDGRDEHVELPGIAQAVGGLGHDDEGEVEDGVILGAVFGAMIPRAALLQFVQLDVDAEAELVVSVEEQFVRFGNEGGGLVVTGQMLADEEVRPGGIRVAILGAAAGFIREIEVAAFAPFFAGIEEEVHDPILD